MRVDPPKSVRLLPSGYWHVRWSPNLWFQWKDGDEPTLGDGFGWVTPAHLRAAVLAVARASEREGAER